MIWWVERLRGQASVILVSVVGQPHMNDKQVTLPKKRGLGGRLDY
jgi:hypothetical protein